MVFTTLNRKDLKVAKYMFSIEAKVSREISLVMNLTTGTPYRYVDYQRYLIL